jgi:membrane associated rhomboid family serine protease
MVQAAVGVRCPECAGRPTGAARLRPRAVARGTAYVTIALIAINVVVFGLQVATDPGGVGTGLGGSVSGGGWLYGPDVASGDWWRIVTSGFLHAGIVHLGFNMVALWILGSRFEAYIGPLRFGLIYAAAVLWGSAGALLLSPDAHTVGASGGVFGLMAAIFLLERQRGISILGDAGLFLGINLIITFTLPGISIGGHLGGILGGGLATLALSGFGRRHMAARRIHIGTLAALLTVIVIGAIGGLVIADRRAQNSPFAQGTPLVNMANQPANPLRVPLEQRG